MQITLLRPITLDNGETVSELNCDIESLSFQDLRVADKVKGFLIDRNPKVQNASIEDKASPRLDPNVRIGLSWAAAMKSDKRLMLNDVLKLSAKDALIIAEESLGEVF